jgi:drug/metabolite transporter (DMT)-like permease
MVIGRLVRDDIGPITLSASRFTVAALFFFVLLQQTPKVGRPTREALPLLAGMALAGVILFSPLLYLGLHYTTAVNGTLINGTGPLLTGLLAAVLIREPMKGRQIVGALLALAGVVWLISGGSFAFWQQTGYNVGDLLVLTAVATWGVYSILSGRVMRLMPAVAATAWSIFLGLPILWAMAAWELYTSPIEMSFKLAMIVIYLGLGPAAIGFYAWNQGVARLGASGAMVFYNTLPLYGALLGALSLGEPIGQSHLVGGLLIIGGGLWASRKR